MQVNEANPVSTEQKDTPLVGIGSCSAEQKELPSGAANPMVMTNSPEVFIADDSIIHTQESQNQDGEVSMVEVIPPSQDISADVILPSDGGNKIPPQEDRRRSKRLMKEITLTTKEKNERMARKQNLEGNCSNDNMFSALPIEEIADLSSTMGVDIDKNDFGTFDLLKDLECARHELFNKQKVIASDPQTETVGASDSTSSPLPIEWIQEESSDTEDFILVLSKKKAREQKKSKILSAMSKGKQIQENPDLKTGSGKKTTTIPVHKKTKIRKNDIARSCVEL